MSSDTLKAGTHAFFTGVNGPSSCEARFFGMLCCAEATAAVRGRLVRQFVQEFASKFAVTVLVKEHAWKGAMEQQILRRGLARNGRCLAMPGMCKSLFVAEATPQLRNVQDGE